MKKRDEREEYPFTDEDLKKACAVVAKAMADSFPAPEECDYTFSPEFKEKMENLLELGIKNVITTLGDQGCLLLNQDGYRQYDAFKVQAIDTVGAGDCFNGALAAYLDKGNNLEDSIQFAQKASSLSVVRNGARDSMPTLEEVKNA